MYRQGDYLTLQRYNKNWIFAFNCWENTLALHKRGVSCRALEKAEYVSSRALRIIFPEKPFNPALTRITICNQTGCDCIVGASNPSLMKGCVLSWNRFLKVRFLAMAEHQANLNSAHLAYEIVGFYSPLISLIYTNLFQWVKWRPGRSH